MELKWEYIEPLESETLISEFEKLVGYKFVDSYKQCVMQNNGGCTNKYVFDTDVAEGRCMGYLFSFNKNGKLTIWDIVDISKSNIEVAEQYGALGECERLKYIFERYVIFADTPFGDEIAFDKTDDSVVFIDHETLNVEKIADSFDEFLNCLRESEDDE